ncbi:MAG: hypothetical protein H0U29_10155 [Acidimicrobiia bacterium]|nr:hypothetical protein [Acidimicrobiia bacterium]
MCGIVGLHLKQPGLQSRLGELLVPMVAALTARGPDSAGIAVYRDDLPEGCLRYSLRAPGPGYRWAELAERLAGALGEEVSARIMADDSVLVASGAPEPLLRALASCAPEVAVVGYGHALEIYKDVGDPAAICDRYDIGRIAGYQGVGHTRMATESAVTTEHSHPFAVGADLTLVHNGSFSNHASIRRRLEDQGVVFETDNDSEVAARYIGHRLNHGDTLDDAMRMVVKEFDGFFTLLVTSRDEFAVVRDAFACKPLVVAETDDYVAVASEYHALAGLPDVESARVFEPQPEEVHSWVKK